MKNVVAALHRHRHRRAVFSAASHFDSTVEAVLLNYLSLGRRRSGLVFTRQDERSLFCMLQKKLYSTGFTSIHGERPSAEYATQRKESLQNEFDSVLTSKISMFYRLGPFLAIYRAAVISFQMFKLTYCHFFVKDIKERSVKFRETLIHLGPFYIKLGQALSTRPDILPAVYCQELAKLQDHVPPFPTRVAIKSIESQLGVPISQVFADISSEPIAAASLGQVYKAHLHSGELVAVKVQRPGMSVLLTLDASLFKMIGGQLKQFANARKDLLVAVNEMVRHMFDEIDYIREGQNAEHFASLFGFNQSEWWHPCDWESFCQIPSYLKLKLLERSPTTYKFSMALSHNNENMVANISRLLVRHQIISYKIKFYRFAKVKL